MARERDMRPAVHAWLSRDGATHVWHEVHIFQAGIVDLVGVRFAEQSGRHIPALAMSTAVELKLADIAGVILQARRNRPWVHQSFAAMPKARCSRMRRDTLRKFLVAGVGLLSVGSVVKVLLAPGPTLWRADGDPDDLRKRWWRRIVREKRERNRFGKEVKD